ncbi:MAG: hypothetical protein HOY79_29670 [Streptomyces sp.]|nr:hypothetical protein [Streptomyces sp.]
MAVERLGHRFQQAAARVDINFNPNGRTKDFDPTKNTLIVGSDTVRGKNPVNPPGYRKGLASGHLLGYQLGGDGGDERNLVPLHDDANSRVMKGIEDKVAAAMQTQTIYYTSRPVYADPANPIPEAVVITAAGTNGFKGTWRVRNVP